jgi:hypothetical protein
MSVQTEPIPPPPQYNDPIDPKDKKFVHSWADWFTRVRDKINALNSSIVTLGQVATSGLITKLADGNWITRSIVGTAGRITVTNGDGNSGNPTIDFSDEAIQDLVAAMLLEGTDIDITYNDTTGKIEIRSTASGGGGGTSDGDHPDKSSKIYVMQRPETGFGVVTATGTSFTSDAMMVAYRQGSSVTCAHNTEASGNHARTGTGTTSTGLVRLFMFGGGPRMNPQAGPCRYSTRIKIPTLSDATNRFNIDVGYSNAITGATRALFASYSDNVNGGQWVFKATDSVGTTTVNTTVAPVAGVHTNLMVEIKNLGTEANLYIEGALAATLTTNIPYVDNLGPMNGITKTVGTAERLLDTQYQEFEQDVSR